MSIQLKDTQIGTLEFAPVDAKGAPAAIEAGSGNAESSNPDVFTVVKNEDGSIDIKAGNPGAAVLQNITADADLGEGVKTISFPDVAVEVLAGEAVGGSVGITNVREQ